MNGRHRNCLQHVTTATDVCRGNTTASANHFKAVFFLKEGNKNIKQLHKEALLPLLLLKLVDMTTETPVSTSNAVQQHKDLQLLSKDSNIR